MDGAVFDTLRVTKILPDEDLPLMKIFPDEDLP